MAKNLVGHHLMRVRIKKNIFDARQDLAQEETTRTGEHVTVSDLVRAACYRHLLIHESATRLQSAPPETLEELGVFIGPSPMLGR